MRFIIVLLLSLCLSSCASVRAHVVYVIDGDTYIVRFADGSTEHVRVIGIDTPETVDPRRPVGCYGPEASAVAKQLLTGKDVILTKKLDEDRDQYKRLLRYVSLGNQDVGGFLIHEGFARAYDRFPHPRLRQYDALQAQAKMLGRGLWKACKKK